MGGPPLGGPPMGGPPPGMGGPPMGGPPPGMGGPPGDAGQPAPNKVQKVRSSDVWTALRKSLKSLKDGQEKAEGV